MVYGLETPYPGCENAEEVSLRAVATKGTQWVQAYRSLREHSGALQRNLVAGDETVPLPLRLLVLDCLEQVHHTLFEAQFTSHVTLRIRGCAQTPSARPSFAELCPRLRSIQRSLLARARSRA